MAQIRLNQVRKTYGKLSAVKDVSFTVEEGEHFILLGTSGCGKTTTLKMINRLVPLSGGSISIQDQDITGISPQTLRRGIGYVLQHNSLFPHYTVGENIGIVPGLLKWPAEKIRTRSAALLEQLRLPPEYLSRYPQALSGGEAQRLNLARALAADPPILLMDEPFGALDPLTRVAIRKDFKSLEAFRKKTIIMVTHDVQEAFEMGHRICLMHEGTVMQTGTPAELLFRPANDFVRDFLAHGQLQLAFTITNIAHLWPYLIHEEERKKSGLIANSHTSLWQVLEQLNNNTDSRVNLQYRADGAGKTVGWGGL
ncbi:MAG: ABC transporter ATP-binding protein, partial [Sphingobacteriales bacterium]